MLELQARTELNKGMIQSTESGLYTWRKKFPFLSHDRTYIAPLTAHVNKIIQEYNSRDDVKVKEGTATLEFRHSTCRLVDLEIGEKKYINDMLTKSLLMYPEDERGTWITEQKFGCFTTGEDGWYRFPTTAETEFKYTHDCMDNIKRPPHEVDMDFNGARHERATVYGHNRLSYSYGVNGLELGSYPEPAVWEFDGRDGKGINPQRVRTLFVYLMPHEIIEDDKPIELPLIQLPH